MEVFEKARRFSDYRLYAKVAQGGMAEIYLGTSPKKEFQGEFLAIKKLHEHLNSNKAFVNLLIHEAKIGVLLNHPSIAQTYDLGSYKSEFFIAMEYVHGKSLDRVLDKIKTGQAPPMPTEIATFVICEILRALAFAHSLKDVKGRELNIIHRDVSPGNILLEYKGAVKLTDFGIATAESRLTPGFSQQSMGKLIYMPPEQVVNDPILKASDLYSLTVVYYQLLSGQLPFRTQDPNEIYREVVNGRMSDIRIIAPKISEGLAQIISKSLDKSPKKRFRTAPEYFQKIHEYFLNNEDLDFDSRTVRSYYRKKLAEYLRRAFADEIIEELNVIQMALNTPETEEDLKATAPIDIPAHVLDKLDDSVSENTVFQPDHTNEATRHYPLTEKERESIIEGLPPKEVIEAAEDPRRESDFELATIPEYDIQMDGSKINSIPVHDRINSASLNQDQVESLKESLPAVEISCSDDLEAFEASTFSGHPKEIDQEIDSEDFGNEHTQVYNDSNAPEEIKPDEKLEPDNKRNISKIKTVNIQVGPSDYLHSTNYRKILNTGTKALFSVFVLVGIIYAFFLGYQNWEFNRTQNIHLLPTQQVSLIFLGEGDTRDQRNLFKQITRKNSDGGLKKIEEIFNKAYNAHTGSDKKVLSLLAHAPVPAEKVLSLDPRASQLILSSSIFDYFTELGFIPKAAADASIYVYLYSQNSISDLQFPDLFSGKRPERTGLIFYNLDDTSNVHQLANLAYEIAYIYGGQNKRDLENGLPLSPEGLANPYKKPLYPQTKAEVMAKSIAIGPLIDKPISSLNDLVIGKLTAVELGWTLKENN